MLIHEGILLAERGAGKRLLLAATACLILFAPLARPAVACAANVSVTPVIAAEGLTELTGDVTITCSGGTPVANGQMIPTVNFTIFYNTSVTSRLFAAQGTTIPSEALLLIDEPGSGANAAPQLLCATITGCTVLGLTGNAEPFNGTAGRPNMFQGVVSGNAATFFGVPIDIPSTGSRVFRFSNIRVNASALSSSTSGATPVITSIAVSGSVSLPISNSTPTVAFAASALKFSVRDGSNAAALTAPFPIQQAPGLATGGNPAAFVRFAENYGTAFTTRTNAAFVNADTSPPPASQAVPGTIYNSASGLTIPVTGGTAGRADQGSRLKATFNNIPSGVRIFVGTTNFVLNGATGVVIGRLTSSETAPFSAVMPTANFGPLPVAEIPVVNGSAAAVWEILRANPNTTENLDFPIWFSASSAGLGTGTVNGSMAPTPPAFTAGAGSSASASLVVPRFADTSTPAPIVQVIQSVILTAIPSAVSFNFQIGSTTMPPPVTLAIALAGATSIGFTASTSTTGGGNWLSVTTAGNTLPGSVTLNANPTGLAANVYFGILTITAPGALNSPLVIQVSFTVSAGTVTANPVLSHIADGAGWKTSIVLVNTGSVAANFTLKFRDESGNPLKLSLGKDGSQSQVTDAIPIGGLRNIQTDGTSTTLVVGSAELVTTNSVGGSAIFAFQTPGQPDSEAVVPITSSRGQSFQLPFDNSPGFALGVAIAVPGDQSAVVSVAFRDETGHQTGAAGPFNIAAHGHTSFVLPGSAGVRGVAEISSPGVDVTGLGIRSHGRAFTSIETLLAVPAGAKNISHIADGQGWKTTIVLVNTDPQPAAFTLRFWGDNGAPLPLSLGAEGVHTQLSGMIPAGGTRTVESDDTASFLATGWGDLVTSNAVGGTAIFAFQSPGQLDSEASVPMLPDGATHFLLPFDGSLGFATGVAFANLGTQNANLTVVFRNVSGVAIGSPTALTIQPNGHTSVVLPVTAQGVADVTADTKVSSLGIRSQNGAFTSIRTLVIAK